MMMIAVSVVCGGGCDEMTQAVTDMTLLMYWV